MGSAVHREPWNKGKIVGQKAPFKLKDIWALRVRLQMENRVTAHDDSPQRRSSRAMAWAINSGLLLRYQ